MIRHASKSAPARPSIQSILSGIRDKSTSTHRTLEFAAVPLWTYRASSFPSAPIRAISVATGLDSHDAFFDPTRRRELQRRRPYPREDRGGDARGDPSVPTHAPGRRRRTMWARSQAHRSEPCCGSVLVARAPAFAVCERPYRPYPSWSHCRGKSKRRPTQTLNPSGRRDLRSRSIRRHPRWRFIYAHAICNTFFNTNPCE